jgi:glycosyltransferase involved in cell wall biosynthesis
MRIAYDHQIFVLQQYGGVSRYFFELASKMADFPDTDVGIVSPVYTNAYLGAAVGRLRVMGRKLPAVRFTGRLYGAIDRLLTPAQLKRFRPDLVHETYYASRRLAPAGSKVVLTVYDMIHERFPQNFSPRDRTFKAKPLAVARADHVICISEQTRKDLIEFLGTDPAKISVVHLGFSLTQPSPAGNPSSLQRPYLLYVGSRGGYKGFESLLRAYAARREVQASFDLVAFGGGAFSAGERALMRDQGLRDEQVRQVGGGDAVLAGLYRGASLFVYPSLYEGFGIPPLEAMSFDCPVVCSDASSIPEVVGDAAELFDPHSPDALGASIERVLGDEAWRRTLIERGRERIKLFSWERCARQTMDIYQGLLA